jgi:serralysin
MTAIATVSPTGDLYIDGILYGAKWAVSSLTFSFPGSASFYGAGYASGETSNDFQAFNGTQQAAVRSILNQYSSVINFKFTEITETSGQHAELRYAESDAPSTAWAYFPSTSATAADAWFNNATGWYDAPALGNYAWQAFQHETGHALGLKHPQDAMGAFGPIPTDHDSLEYTVMSYRSYIGAPTTSGYTNEAYGYPQTLMMLDVAALQTMYGANFSTNLGNTVYEWNPATGQESINGVLQPDSPANKIFMNIWDGGGHDTYNFSSYTTNLKVDLRPGQWTTASTAQLASLGAGHVAIGNISNSLLYQNNPASLIEDAIGGSGNDTITGNQVDNKLTGGHGNDTLNGDLGTDTAVYSGPRASYQLTHNANGSWTIADLRSGNPDGTDTLTNIEQAQFSNQLVVLNNITTTATLAAPLLISFSNDSGVIGDRITNDTTLTFTGSGTAGSTIKLYDGTLLVGSALVASTGSWAVTTAALANGAHTFTSVATNAGVNSASSAPLTITIDTSAPGKPVISGFTPDTNILTDHITNASVLTLTGAAEAGSKVQVFDGANLIGTATAAASGAWNLVTPSEAAGLHHFSATATDAAGNVSVNSALFDVTVDKVAPSAPVISGFSPDTDTIGDHHTKATVITLTGTAEANSSVKIYDGSLLLGSAQTSATGSWNFGTAALSTGNHTFTAKAADLAGNLSGASAAYAVAIDAIAIPGRPVISGFSPDTNISTDHVTNASVLTLTGVADAGSKVQVFDGANLIGTATAAASGAWDLITPSEAAGLHHFSATAINAAGNVSAVSATFDVTIDKAAPNAPVISGFSPDTDTIGDHHTRATTLTLTGVAEANSSVAIYDGSLFLGSAETSAAGGWSFATAALGAGGHTFTAKASDLAGNLSVASAGYAVTIDPAVVAPVVVNTAPVVSAHDLNAARGQVFAASSLFTVFDANHDAITRYEFYDNTGAANSGHFKINGVAQTDGTIIDIAANQLARTTFTAGAGADALSVRAFDGKAWSDWTFFHVTAPDQPPVVTPRNVSAGQNVSLAASSLFSVTDADHDPITAYQFFDNSAASNSGHFIVNGVAKATGTIIDVSASQLAQTSFHTGTAPDSISVRAFDGVAWSAWTSLKVTTAVNHAPVVVSSDVVTSQGAVLRAAGLFTVTDADHNAITAYQFMDYSTAANSGHFVVNDATQGANTLINVSAAQLGQTTFVAGAAPDILAVRAFDGSAWSAWSQFDVSTSNHIPIITTQSATISPHLGAPQFSATDPDHDPITMYQCWDNTADPASGHFTVNGVTQAAGALIQLAPNQLSSLGFVAGTVADHLTVRASDGMDWSVWTPISVASTAKPAAGSSPDGHAASTDGNAPDNKPAPPHDVSQSYQQTPAITSADTSSATVTPSTAQSYTAASVAPDAFLFGAHVSQPSADPWAAPSVSHDAFPAPAQDSGHATAFLTAQPEAYVALPTDTAHLATLDPATTAILQHYQTDHFLA